MDKTLLLNVRRTSSKGTNSPPQSADMYRLRAVGLLGALILILASGCRTRTSVVSDEQVAKQMVAEYLERIARESALPVAALSGVHGRSEEGDKALLNVFSGQLSDSVLVDPRISESIFLTHKEIRGGMFELIKAGIAPGRFVNNQVFIIREDQPTRIISSKELTPGHPPPPTELGQRIVSRADMFSTVAIFDKDGIECIGSGVRVSTNVVVTAKHVVEGRLSVSIRCGDNVDSTRPRVIARVVPLSPKVASCPTFAPDFGAVVMSDGSKLDAPIASISWASELPVAFSVSVGYGLTKEELLRGRIESKQSRSIGWAAVTISNKDGGEYLQCPSAEFLVGEFIPSSVNSSSCDGDSGGGNYMIDAYGRLHLIGITSRGIRDRSGLSCGYGSVYTRMAQFKRELSNLIVQFN